MFRNDYKTHVRQMAGTALLALVLASFICILSPGLTFAEAIGKFTALRGSVDILKAGADKALPAAVGGGVEAGDIVRTKSLSRAQVTLADGSVINIAEKSRIEIKEFSFEPEKGRRSGVLRSMRGTLRATVPKGFTGEGSRFEVHTPTAVAAVRGTDFMAIIERLTLATDVLVFDGIVGVRNIDPRIAGEALLKAKEATTVYRDEPPSPPRGFMTEEYEFFSRHTDPKDAGDDETGMNLKEDFEPAAEGVPQLTMPPADGGAAPEADNAAGLIDAAADTVLGGGAGAAPPVTQPITETVPGALNSSPSEIIIVFP